MIMCLVRAPLDESTEAHIVHFWGWRDPGFCWLGLLLPFVDFLTGTSSDEDDVWSTPLSWISSSQSLSPKTTFSWRSSLNNLIWQNQSFDFEQSKHQNCFTCRTVSAFANSTTECVIKWRDNSSHLLFYTKEKTLKSWYTLNRTFGTPNNGRFFVLRSTCLLFSTSKQHFWK